MAGEVIDLWYNNDTSFYLMVVMLTFTSIVGTLLFYKEKLLVHRDKEENEEEASTEDTKITRCLHVNDEGDESSSGSDRDNLMSSDAATTQLTLKNNEVEYTSHQENVNIGQEKRADSPTLLDNYFQEEVEQKREIPCYHVEYNIDELFTATPYDISSDFSDTSAVIHHNLATVNETEELAIDNEDTDNDDIEKGKTLNSSDANQQNENKSLIFHEPLVCYVENDDVIMKKSQLRFYPIHNNVNIDKRERKLNSKDTSSSGRNVATHVLLHLSSKSNAQKSERNNVNNDLLTKTSHETCDKTDERVKYRERVHDSNTLLCDSINNSNELIINSKSTRKADQGSKGGDVIKHSFVACDKDNINNKTSVVEDKQHKHLLDKSPFVLEDYENKSAEICSENNLTTYTILLEDSISFAEKKNTVSCSGKKLNAAAQETSSSRAVLLTTEVNSIQGFTVQQKNLDNNIGNKSTDVNGHPAVVKDMSNIGHIPRNKITNTAKDKNDNNIALIKPTISPPMKVDAEHFDIYTSYTATTSEPPLASSSDNPMKIIPHTNHADLCTNSNNADDYSSNNNDHINPIIISVNEKKKKSSRTAEKISHELTANTLTSDSHDLIKFNNRSAFGCETNTDTCFQRTLTTDDSTNENYGQNQVTENEVVTPTQLSRDIYSTEDSCTNKNRETMGKIISKIFDADTIDELPLEHVQQLGGTIIISADGDYVIVNIEGKRREFKINRRKARAVSSTTVNKRLRDSKDLSELFEHLESLDVIAGENREKDSSSKHVHSDPNLIYANENKNVTFDELNDKLTDSPHNNSTKEATINDDTLTEENSVLNQNNNDFVFSDELVVSSCGDGDDDGNVSVDTSNDNKTLIVDNLTELFTFSTENQHREFKSKIETLQEDCITSESPLAESQQHEEVRELESVSIDNNNIGNNQTLIKESLSTRDHNKTTLTTEKPLQNLQECIVQQSSDSDVNRSADTINNNYDKEELLTKHKDILQHQLNHRIGDYRLIKEGSVEALIAIDKEHKNCRPFGKSFGLNNDKNSTYVVGEQKIIKEEAINHPFNSTSYQKHNHRLNENKFLEQHSRKSSKSLLTADTCCHSRTVSKKYNDKQSHSQVLRTLSCTDTTSWPSTSFYKSKSLDALHVNYNAAQSVWSSTTTARDRSRSMEVISNQQHQTTFMHNKRHLVYSAAKIKETNIDELMQSLHIKTSPTEDLLNNDHTTKTADNNNNTRSHFIQKLDAHESTIAFLEGSEYSETEIDPSSSDDDEGFKSDNKTSKQFTQSNDILQRNQTFPINEAINFQQRRNSDNFVDSRLTNVTEQLNLNGVTCTEPINLKRYFSDSSLSEIRSEDSIAFMMPPAYRWPRSDAEECESYQPANDNDDSVLLVKDDDIPLTKCNDDVTYLHNQSTDDVIDQQSDDQHVDTIEELKCSNQNNMDELINEEMQSIDDNSKIFEVAIKKDHTTGELIHEPRRSDERNESEIQITTNDSPANINSEHNNVQQNEINCNTDNLLHVEEDQKQSEADGGVFPDIMNNNINSLQTEQCDSNKSYNTNTDVHSCNSGKETMDTDKEDHFLDQQTEIMFVQSNQEKENTEQAILELISLSTSHSIDATDIGCVDDENIQLVAVDFQQSEPVIRLDSPKFHSADDRSEPPTSHFDDDGLESPTSHSGDNELKSPIPHSDDNELKSQTSHSNDNGLDSLTSHSGDNELKLPISHSDYDELKSTTTLSDVDELKSPTSHSDDEKLNSSISHSDVDKLKLTTTHSDVNELKSPTSHSDVDELKPPTTHSDVDELKSPASHSDDDKLMLPKSHSDVDKLKSRTFHSDVDELKPLTSHSDGLESRTFHSDDDKLKLLTSHSDVNELNSPTTHSGVDELKLPASHSDDDKLKPPKSQSDFHELKSRTFHCDADELKPVTSHSDDDELKSTASQSDDDKSNSPISHSDVDKLKLPTTHSDDNELRSPTSHSDDIQLNNQTIDGELENDIVLAFDNSNVADSSLDLTLTSVSSSLPSINKDDFTRELTEITVQEVQVTAPLAFSEVLTEPEPIQSFPTLQCDNLSTTKLDRLSESIDITIVSASDTSIISESKDNPTIAHQLKTITNNSILSQETPDGTILTSIPRETDKTDGDFHSLEEISESTSLSNISDIMFYPLKPSVEISYETETDTASDKQLPDISGYSSPVEINLPINDKQEVNNSEDINLPAIEQSTPASNLNASDESSYSLVEGECLDSTRNIKDALLIEQITPRKGEEIKSTKPHSDLYPSVLPSNEYPLSKQSKPSSIISSTIQGENQMESPQAQSSIEVEQQTVKPRIVIEEKITSKRIAVANEVADLENLMDDSQQTEKEHKIHSLPSDKNISSSQDPSTAPSKSKENSSGDIIPRRLGKDSLARRFPSESSLQFPSATFISSDNSSIPRRLEAKDGYNQRLSHSLHNIFTSDDLETDIDNVDDQELWDILKSPGLKERSPDVMVTDVDRLLLPKSSFTQRKFVIVSKIGHRYSLRQKSRNNNTSIVPIRSSSWGQKSTRPMSVTLHNREVRQQVTQGVVFEDIQQPWQENLLKISEQKKTKETANVTEHANKEGQLKLDQPKLGPMLNEASQSNYDDIIVPTLLTNDVKSPNELTSSFIKEKNDGDFVLPGMSVSVDVNVARWVSSTVPEEEIIDDDSDIVSTKDTESSSDTIISQEIRIEHLEQTNETSSIATSASNVVDSVVCTSVNLYQVKNSEERPTDKQILTIPDSIIAEVKYAGGEKDNNNNVNNDKVLVKNDKNQRHSKTVRDSWDFWENPVNSSVITDKNIEQGIICKRATNESPSIKHKSWNILDLKAYSEDSRLERFIQTLADVPEKKRDSIDIESLFQKYHKEREALEKLREKSPDDTKRESISDFSEISSISDDTSTHGSWYQNVSDVDDSGLSSNKATKLENSPSSTFVKPGQMNVNKNMQNPVDDDKEHLNQANDPIVFPDVSTNHIQIEAPSSPLGKESPEIAETVIKPLPSPRKPDFVPQISNFNEEDLGNMVMAQAVSAVRKRRGGRGRKTLNVDETKSSNVDTTKVESTVKHEAPEPHTFERNTALNNTEEDISSTICSEDRDVPPRTDTKKATVSPKIPRAMKDIQPSESPILRRTQQVWSIDKTEGKENPTDESEDNELIPSKLPKRAATFSSKATAKKVLVKGRHSFNTKDPTPIENKRQSNIVLRNASFHESNARSYDYVNSMPNLHIKSRWSFDRLPHESDDYHSETSMISGLDSCLEGSIADEQVFLYPSMHNPNKEIKQKPLVDEWSDSSGDESFTTESSPRHSRLTSKDTERTVYCGNPPCSRRQVMVGLQKSQFIACNSCFTCYCSKTCKRIHWKEHRKSCFFGRISVYIKTLVRKCETDTKLNSDLRHLSLHHYQLKGRGCLVLQFESPSDAKSFVTSKIGELTVTPSYSTIDSILKRDKKTKHSRILSQSIIDYDPEQEFIINVSIKIGKSPISPSTLSNSSVTSKKRTNNVVRCARISMQGPLQSERSPRKSSSYFIRTFCLPKVIVDEDTNDAEVRRYYCKELSFSLKRCGITLKLDYPEAYEKLCTYVEHEKAFLPIVLYGQKSDRNFKCILHQGKYNPSEEARGEGVLV